MIKKRVNYSIDGSAKLIRSLDELGVGGLYVEFYEGHGHVRAELIAGPKKVGELLTWYCFSLSGGGVREYLAAIRQVRRTSPELLRRGGWWKSFKSLVLAIYEVMEGKWTKL